MAVDFLKQSNTPLFEELLWNRPVNRRAAKSLAIVGGHKTQFSFTQSIYQSAKASGIGSVRVLLPESVRQYTGSFDDAVFLPATASGSFSLKALDQLNEYATHSNGLILSGEFSKNKETVSLIERFMSDTEEALILNGGVAQDWSYAPNAVFAHSNRMIVGSIKDYKKIANALKITKTIKPELGVLNRIKLLEKIAEYTKLDLNLISDYAIVQAKNQTSVTEVAQSSNLATPLGLSATFWVQNPDKFKAITTANFILKNVVSKSEKGTLQNIQTFLRKQEKL